MRACWGSSAARPSMARSRPASPLRAFPVAPIASSREAWPRGTSLSRQVAARVIHQDVTNRLRRHTEKVGAVLPADVLLIHHPEVGFMDQGRALESMVGALTAEITLGHAAQLAIDKRHQPLQRLAIAVTPVFKQLSDVVGQTLSVSIPMVPIFS